MSLLALLKPCGPNCYMIERQGTMRADVLVYLNRELYDNFEEEQSLEQLTDAASLPGVISPVLGMPDIHSGFGLPIGGVMAMDTDHGLVSAGAVGMDINCGVRLLRSGLNRNELSKETLRKLLQAIGSRVPGGIGQLSPHASLVKKNLEDIFTKGVAHLVEMGIGRPEDLDLIEDQGKMSGASTKDLSDRAIKRSLQLSTIGGGNHFIEIGYIEKVFDHNAAAVYGLQEEAVTILIHTGSRGLGHQVCTDYSRLMKKMAKHYKINLPSAGLAAVPIKSKEGQSYLSAMACAANFAFANRHWITDDVKKAFFAVLGKNTAGAALELVYDVAHNTARFETIEGQKMLVHRKGAVRALPPGHRENGVKYRQVAHPVLVPGSMGSSSYVVRAEKGISKLFNSVNHGAGRTLSRTAAKKSISVGELKESLGEVLISGRNYAAYLDEAPQAYKDIEAVIETLTEISLCQKVARLKPLAVFKGEGGS